MKDTNWNLIAKHLSKETDSSEEVEFSRLMESDPMFKREFEASKKAWDFIEVPKKTFNKTRIQNLRDQKIKQAAQKMRFRSLLKYVAIFIGFALGALFVYQDLNSTVTIIADGYHRLEVNLPDESVVLLKKDAQITYSDALLKIFDRKVKIKGQAYFEITKMKEHNFIVETNECNIEVLGTKFNVNTNEESTSIVLTEGSIALNHFQNPNIENTNIVPGQMAYLQHNNQQLTISKVNTRIYTSWTKNKLEFDDFSISELGEIFHLYYNKTLIVDSNINLNNRVGGTAPTDDINLIIKGLSIVLKREITEQNDTIFIK